MALALLPVYCRAQLAHAIPAGDSALALCARAAKAGEKGEANREADAAERQYGAADTIRGDVTPAVRRARVLAECRLPVASFFSKGKFGSGAERLLQQALATDSTNWEARYTLALLNSRAPAFLGKRNDAVREFETLLRQQGAATDFAEAAAPYAYLGDLYEREGRHADAAAVWRRGAALFPNDAGLRKRLATMRP